MADEVDEVPIIRERHRLARGRDLRVPQLAARSSSTERNISMVVRGSITHTRMQISPCQVVGTISTTPALAREWLQAWYCSSPQP